MRYLFLALLLTGCGKAATLKPVEGAALPPAPYGTAATPTPDQLVTPPSQARPSRADELLRSSQDRRDDEFDIPPN